MRVIRMSDIGCSSGRSFYLPPSFSQGGFVMDDGEYQELDEDTEELVEAISVPVQARATRLLEGTRC